MRKRVLSALAATIAWVGFDGSGNIGSTALAWGGVPSKCWVTFGGKINLDDGFATFGGNVVAPHGDLITGHILVADHDSDKEYFCRVTFINVCECFTNGTGGVLQFTGNLEQLGKDGGPIGTCTVTVVDNGEPGRSDTIKFDTFGNVTTSIPVGPTFQLLPGGNVQIHGCRAFGANGG